MKRSKIIYIDMDDVLANFNKAARDPKDGSIREYMMWDKNFFLNLEPIPGSQGSVFELQKMGFDVYVLSQPLAESAESYVEKAKWIQIYFPQLYKRLILTQNKGLHIGEYLIDDNQNKWKAKFESSGGTFIHFKYGGYNGPKETWCNPEERWKQIVEYFKSQDPEIVTEVY